MQCSGFMILLLVKTLRKNLVLFEERNLTILSKFKICLIRQHVINNIEISRSEKNINLNENNRSNSRQLQKRGCKIHHKKSFNIRKDFLYIYTKYDNGKVELQPPAERDKCRIPPSLKAVHFTIEV